MARGSQRAPRPMAPRPTAPWPRAPRAVARAGSGTGANGTAVNEARPGLASSPAVGPPNCGWCWPARTRCAPCWATAAPPPLAWLRASTERACALAAAERLRRARRGARLACCPAWRRQSGPRRRPSIRDLYELMAIAYQACAAALARLGRAEASWIAADRAMVAAERAGNLLLGGRRRAPAGVGLPGRRSLRAWPRRRPGPPSTRCTGWPSWATRRGRRCAAA